MRALNIGIKNMGFIFCAIEEEGVREEEDVTKVGLGKATRSLRVQGTPLL